MFWDLFPSREKLGNTLKYEIYKIINIWYHFNTFSE